MEDPPKTEVAGAPPTSNELQADLARLLALLLNNDDITSDNLHKEVDHFLSVYLPLRHNEVWISQHSQIVASTYIVSVLVDRFDLFEPMQFLQLLLFCASVCTYFSVVLISLRPQRSQKQKRQLFMSKNTPETFTEEPLRRTIGTLPLTSQTLT